MFPEQALPASYMDGMRLAAERSFGAAAQRFTEAEVEAFDATSKAQCSLRASQALWQDHRKGEADSHLLAAEALANVADSAVVLLNIGHEWMVRGQTEQARRALTRVADASPDHWARAAASYNNDGMSVHQAFAEYELAGLELDEKNLDAAEGHLQKCIASQHEEIAPYALTRYATELRNRLTTIKREELLIRAVDYDHPDASPEAAFELGLLYEELLAASAAREMFERAAGSMHPEVMSKATQRIAAAPNISARGVFTMPQNPVPTGHRRVIVCGAGTGAQDYTSSAMQLGLPLEIVGYLDDDDERLQRHKAPVLGKLSALPRVIREKTIHDVVFAIPSASGSLRAEVLETCRQANVPMHDLPSMYTLNVDVPVAQQIDHPVSLDALIGSKPRVVDREAGLWLRNLNVVVTGAGSALGAELCRRALNARAAQVFAVEPSAQQRVTLRQYLARSGFDRVQVVAHSPEEERIDAMFCVSEPGASDAVEEVGDVVRQALADAAERVARGTRVMFVSAYVPSDRVASLQRASEHGILSRLSSSTPLARIAAIRVGETLRGVHGPLTHMEEDGRSGVPIVVRGPIRRRLFTVERAVELVLQAADIAEPGQTFTTCGGEDESLESIAKLVADQHERLGDDRLPVIRESQDRPDLVQEDEHMSRLAHQPQLALVRGLRLLPVAMFAKPPGSGFPQSAMHVRLGLAESPVARVPKSACQVFNDVTTKATPTGIESPGRRARQDAVKGFEHQLAFFDEATGKTWRDVPCLFNPMKM